MTRVLVTVGPQGAGKSTFCRSILSLGIKGLAYASRDDFLVGRYGKAAWDPYSGAMYEGMSYFWEHTAQLIGKNNVVLLECFCPTLSHFHDMLCSISEYVDWTNVTVQYEALYFVTPDYLCAEWYAKRTCDEKGTEASREASRLHAKSGSGLFHDRIRDFARYFDVVREVDPRQLTLFPYSELWRLDE